MEPIEKGSPRWWLDRLSVKLADKQPRLKKLRDYAVGDHPLPEAADPKWKERADAFARRSRTNYCGLAAAAVRERLHPVGIRSGEDGDEETDSFLWGIWQASHLDADSERVHDASLTMSESYVICGQRADGTPIATAEDPRLVITEASPLNWREPLAGLKQWLDPVANDWRAIVYLPDTISYFKRDETQWQPCSSDFETIVDEGENVEENRLGEVPIERFVNRMSHSGQNGLAEFEDAIDVQERINHLSLNLLQIAESQAFRQRYVKGLPTKDDDDNDIPPPFEAIVHSLWAVEDTDVVFGEFAQVDLSPLLNALKAAIEAFVTLTGLPPHYVAGDLVNASADAFAAAETRLTAKVRSKQRGFGESWERVLRLCAAWAGREVPEDIELIWEDPERKTSAQLSDAALKAGQFGVPWRTRMADYGKTPQEIKRMRKEREEDAAYDAKRSAAAAAELIGADDGADSEQRADGLDAGGPGAACPAFAPDT